MSAIDQRMPVAEFVDLSLALISAWEAFDRRGNFHREFSEIERVLSFALVRLAQDAGMTDEKIATIRSTLGI